MARLLDFPGHLAFDRLAVSGLGQLALEIIRGKGRSIGVWQRVFTRDLLSGSAVRRARLLDVNPVLWLLDDSRRMRWVAWLLALGGIGVLVVVGHKAGFAFLFFGRYALSPFYFLLKMLVAIQACRFFSETRRTGALELLCCTPLTMREVIRGQWMLLRRVFLWPLGALLLAHLTGLGLVYLKGPGISFPGATTPGILNLFTIFQVFVPIPNNIADFFALGWFGMWLALSTQKPNMAAGLTILCVMILPMIAWCVPTLATDAVFITIGWVKLSEDFRLRQAQWVTPKPAIA